MIQALANKGAMQLQKGMGAVLAAVSSPDAGKGKAAVVVATRSLLSVTRTETFSTLSLAINLARLQNTLKPSLSLRTLSRHRQVVMPHVMLCRQQRHLRLRAAS